MGGFSFRGIRRGLRAADRVLLRQPIIGQAVRCYFTRAFFIYEPNTNLVCQALPCFGDAFVHRAVESLPHVDERKQTRLVLGIARTGRESIPCLVRLSEDPSPNVRAAACLGLGELIDPYEADIRPELLELRRSFLCTPIVSQEQVDTFYEREDAIRCSRFPLTAEVPRALVKRSEDDYQSVRIAAVGMLSWLLQNYTFRSRGPG